MQPIAAVLAGVQAANTTFKQDALALIRSAQTPATLATDTVELSQAALAVLQNQSDTSAE